MKIKKYAACAAVVFSSSMAAAIDIEKPLPKAVISSANGMMEVDGKCQLGQPVQVEGKDSAKLSTGIVWTGCQGDGWYATPFDIAKLKNGSISVKAWQKIKNKTVSASVSVTKKVGVTPAPSPSPVPSPSASPAPTVTPPVTSKIPMGFTGHEGLSVYTYETTEARFKFMNENNMRVYRTAGYAIDNLDYAAMDQLIVLAKKYNITLRPGMWKDDQALAYSIAKRYAKDIKVWEIGNEADADPSQAAEKIAIMVKTYKGIKQASDELNAGLKTTITIMACNIEDKSPNARCPGDKNGITWFLDQAKATGFNFDYIGFHYYPYFGDKGYWMDMYLYQMRHMAEKFKAKILYNELNCGEIYQGTTDGGHPGDGACYDSVNQILTILNRDYRDIIQEINMYEFQDNPNHPVEHERHFGILYDLAHPKPVFNVIKSFAK